MTSFSDFSSNSSASSFQAPACKKGCCPPPSSSTIASVCSASASSAVSSPASQVPTACKKGCCSAPVPIYNPPSSPEKGKEKENEDVVLEFAMENESSGEYEDEADHVSMLQKKKEKKKDRTALSFFQRLFSSQKQEITTAKPFSSSRLVNKDETLLTRLFNKIFLSQPLVNEKTSPSSSIFIPSTSSSKQPHTSTLKFKVEGMNCCSSCSVSIEQTLNRLPGVLNMKTFPLTEKLYIQVDSTLTSDHIRAEIQRAGFKSQLIPDDTSNTQLSITIVPSSSSTLSDPSLITLEDFCASVAKVPGLLSIELLDEEGSVLSSFVGGKGGNEKTQPQLTLEVGAPYPFRVHFDSEVTGVRSLIEKLNKSPSLKNFSVKAEVRNDKSSQTHNLGREGLNDAGAHDRWKNQFWWCFGFTVPVVMIYFLNLIPRLDSFFNYHLIGRAPLSAFFSLALSTPTQFYISREMYLSAWRSLIVSRVANMDVLIVLSTSAAYFYSTINLFLAMTDKSEAGDYDFYFDTAAILMTLVIMGRYLEVKAIKSTSSAISKLMELQSETALLVLSSDSEEEIDIRLIERGDILKVLPGSRFPTDGTIVSGTTTVDESMVTGESRLISKGPGEAVIGGTINQFGAVTMRATHLPSEGTLSRICKLVEETQASKAPIQRITDTISSYFVPFIVILAFSTFIVWLILAETNSLPESIHPKIGSVPFALMFALTVLVISCPCAFSLSAPTAIMVATGVGAKCGILFKGGAVIESAHRTTTIVFDKTGTLTEGTPRVVDTDIYVRHIKRREFFQMVGSAERASEHAIGRAIVEYAEKTEKCCLVSCEDAFIVPGRGVKCTVVGAEMIVGNNSWMEENEVAKPQGKQQQELVGRFEREGMTAVYVAVDGELVGCLGLTDTAKKEAKEVVQTLKEMGLDVRMMSGDNEMACLKLAEEIGIDKEKVNGKLLPNGKSNLIKRLQEEGRVVAMIGDGVNDSISMIQAHVGVALGAGTDVAIEAADVILMKNDLRDILVLLDISKKTFERIKLNIAWAFLYNLIGIPFACGMWYPLFGFQVPPSIAGFSEIFSSIPVVLFSLLLKNYKPPFLHHSTTDETAEADRDSKRLIIN